MSRIAHEVSRRLTPEYAKERAREMARDRMYRARDRAIENSWFAPLLGAGLGALVAKALQSRAQERGWDRDRFEYRGDFAGRAYGYPRGSYADYASRQDAYGEYGTGLPAEGFGGPESSGDTGSRMGDKAAELKERARAGAEEMKERARAGAEEMKDRARAGAEQVKDRLHDVTSSVRERLPDRDRIRASTYEDTGLWALGALALGALFGFALPETQREREMLEPARRKARELGQQARDRALEKGAEAMEKATEKVGSMGAPQGQQQTGEPGSPPSLH